MPPVITGQSLVTEQVYNILINRFAKISLFAIDDNSNSLFAKFVNYIKLFFNFTISAISCRRQVVYLPGARSVIGFWRNAYIISVSKFLGHTIVTHFHTGDYNNFLETKSSLFQRINKYIYNKVDFFIILSVSLFTNYDLVVDRKKVVVIPNGVAISKNICNNKFYKNKINILYLSNLIESKGYLDLLKAISILINDYNIVNLECHFCGEFLQSADDVLFKNTNEARNHFNNFIKQNGLENNVFYHGLLSGNLKTKVLNECDIFVLPTYYSTEAQPLSILEALSHGKLVVTTNHRAIADMIIDEFTGLIVPKCSPDSIAKSIYRLVNDLKLSNELSLNALEFVSKNYSKEVFEKRIVIFFENLDII